jgi:hypothetical protein
MKTHGFALLCALVLGCGEDESGPELTGVWFTESGGDYECAYGISFESDGTYAESTVCTLTDGSIGAEVYGGTYTAGNGQLTLHQTHGTCPAKPLTVEVSYELDGDTLRLQNASQVKVLSRAEDDGQTGQAQYGCYAQDGSFTPRPISPL